jgi:hypothetical protein
VPISCELTPANAADVGLVEELLAEANLGEEVVRGLLGDLAYRSRELEKDLAELGIVLVTGEASARRPGEVDGLHLRLLGQPDDGSSSRQDRGSVGINLATHI